ncbi:LTA synthase family protein [Rhodoferax antarcticus]|uniref:LTA synthase family protein n=1 Tax=Rhodoferax antarcticus TaxID=81479 RepID=UPI0022242117|nr:LTA synthase family protein [Rhodoferax antarcticus]MCW2312497.1 hypothetical protein [Rhodoferax antarcticus]
MEAVFVLLAAGLGLGLSVAVEALMTPRPRHWRARARASVALHAGIWLGVFVVLVLALGRPWFALAAELALLLLVVLVNNAKVKSLREPFVFQDYEYFTDAIRHPRLYIPFLGWGNAAAVAVGFTVAVVVGLWLEPVPKDRWAWSGQLGAITMLAGLAALLLLVGHRAQLVATFDPVRDVQKLGLLASLWRYGWAERVMPALGSPFAGTTNALASRLASAELPHLVAVQSESFFDPRSLFLGIRDDVLAEFDQLKDQALAHGRLTVPAWGANTVRSEFAFLSGIDAATLGVHRFNPYRKLVHSGVPTLASYLKQLGYRTVCVHPYPASFYRRSQVYPLLGFDEFIDIRSFSQGQRVGPYTGDVAVAQKIADILKNATGPVFVFAITMENHGPLHLETPNEDDVANLYNQKPPPGCGDLTIYLRHLRSADQMAAMLKATLAATARPASLCWYGDHVPIMELAYQALGEPDGQTEFLIWGRGASSPAPPHSLGAHQLAVSWLRYLGLMEAVSSQNLSEGSP